MAPIEGIHTGETLPDVPKTSEGVQEGVETQEIIPQDIQNILQDTSIWDSSKGDQQKALQDFENFIKNNPNIKESIFQHLRQIDINTLGDYVYENGYIINQDTLLAFQTKFQISNIQEKQVEKNKDKSDENKDKSDENKDKSDEIRDKRDEIRDKSDEIRDKSDEIETTDAQKQQIDSFRNIFENQVGNLASVQGAQETFDLVLAAQNDLQKAPEAIQAIETFFQNLARPEKKADFQKVAETFRQQGDAQYQEYKNYALSVNPSLQANFESFETAPQSISDIPSDLHQAQIVAGVGTENFKTYGSIVEASQDGQVTRMDMGEIPPTRSIALEGSNFSLETDVPVGDFYPAIAKEGLDYEASSKENAPKISFLKALEGSQVQDFINGPEFQKESLANCMRIIATLIGLPKDMKLSDIYGKDFSTKEALHQALSPSGIMAQKESLDKKIQEKKKAYQEALKNQIKRYSEHLKETDEITKKALQICKNAGFDQLDISFILSQLSGSMMPDIGIPFDKNNIDIATLNFGQGTGEAANESNFAQRIYRTMNMLLFQNPFGTDANGDQVGFDLSAIARNPQGQLKNPSEIKMLLQENGIINSNTGSMNKELVMQRFTQGQKNSKAR